MKNTQKIQNENEKVSPIDSLLSSVKFILTGWMEANLPNLQMTCHYVGEITI